MFLLVPGCGWTNVDFHEERPINCAHRGASGHAPENTLAALEKAIALGADMAEIDVQPTADDSWPCSTTTLWSAPAPAPGRCGSKPWPNCGAGRGLVVRPGMAGQTHSPLGEVLDFTRGRLPLNIEMKVARPRKGRCGIGMRHCMIIILRIIAAAGLVTSFDTDCRRDQAADPDLTVGSILGRAAVPDMGVPRRVDVLSAEKSLVDAAFMDRRRVAPARRSTSGPSTNPQTCAA